MLRDVEGDEPPECPRCGCSAEWVVCHACGGEGVDGHECGEDCCACADPEDNVPCEICDGERGWLNCLSSQEWCESHPLEPAFDEHDVAPVLARDDSGDEEPGE